MPFYTSGLVGNTDPHQFATETPNLHLCTPSMPFPVLSTPIYASCTIMWPRGRLRPSPICNRNPQPPPLYPFYAISCAIYAFLCLMYPHVASWTTLDPRQFATETPNRHLCTPSMPFPVLSMPFYTSCALMWPHGQPGPSPICNRNPNRHLCTPSMPFPVLSTPFYASCALMWPRGRLRPSPICNINPQPPPLYTYAISCAIYAFLRLVCPHVASWTTQTLANLQQKPNALGSNCVHPASYLSSGLSLKHVPSIRVAGIDQYFTLPHLLRRNPLDSPESSGLDRTPEMSHIVTWWLRRSPLE